MNSLASAVVYAVAFVNVYPEDSGGLDGRLASKVTENILWELRNATESEMDALAAAAEQALAMETTAEYPREEWIETYRNWMEHMFGEDNWKNNKRIDQGKNQTVA